MSWIEKIQNKPREQKIKFILVAVIITAILLIIIWIITLRFNKHVAKDTTLFDTIGKGVQDVKNNFKNNTTTPTQ